MKIAVVGLADFPQGKKSLADQRLETLEGIIKPSKTTHITIEFLGIPGVKEADGIICEKEAKLELIIIDLEVVENRLLKGADPLFVRVKEILEKNVCLSEESFSEEERKILLNSNLVSIKPIYFASKNENKAVEDIMFESYYAFGMICFITGAKDKELKAWPIKKGQTASEAAGAIHSDIQKRFAKAEVIGYEDVVKAGSLSQARQFMHLEGKDYVMKDADVITILTSNK